MRSSDITPIHDRAADNLRFIRSAMQRASEFTAVPGVGGFVMGVVAIAAGLVAAPYPPGPAWLRVWLIALIAGALTGAATMAWKAKRVRMALFSGAGRKFMLSFLPPVVAGGLLTLGLLRIGNYALLPGVWLLLYGAGAVSGGSSSIRLIPLMGLCFCVCGALALAVPAWGNTMMIAGFGGAQVLFGILIARRHGG